MTIEILIGIAGLFISWLVYLRSFKPPPKEDPIDERENLKVYFLMVQKIYLQTQDLIEIYISENSAENEFIFDNVTYGFYLKKMKVEFNRCNSNQVYENYLSLPFSKSTIDSMMESLRVQYNSLIQVKFKMEVLLNDI
ncbi:hypothetical protein ACMDB5_14615 [Flavobacterium sp. W1B]|uniref:hypothetical protein n=1 Tax=Flavobacterium sp. W1B TaxID=3394146 RepID=UPI0039BC65F7